MPTYSFDHRAEGVVTKSEMRLSRNAFGSDGVGEGGCGGSGRGAGRGGGVGGVSGRVGGDICEYGTRGGEGGAGVGRSGGFGIGLAAD